MSSEPVENYDDVDGERYKPERDERGRYLKGCTGNPSGRPRKLPAHPKPLARIMADALAKEVAVKDNGIPQTRTYLELLTETMLRGAVKAKPKEILHILLQLEKIAADAPPDEEEVEFDDIFTEEERQLLQIIERARAACAEPICPRCNLPVGEEAPARPLPPGLD